MQTNGIHHVTAVATDPEANVAFYTDALGLRLVKKTVNFDDPSTYHLYYGDETGTPGTILTFFPFEGGRQGRPGRGQATATAFTIPEGAVDYWVDRLDARGVDVDEPEERFGATVVRFRDPDGQPLELVTGESDVKPRSNGPVPGEHAIRGFHGVTLDSADPEATASVLELLGYERADADGDQTRYVAPGERASAVDLLTGDGQSGSPGAGTVHHVAFRAPDEETQLEWREELADAGLRVTPQKDRQYFQSVYFREPGGILFEIATDPPGFTRDETVDELGSELKLPPWLEEKRDLLEERLPEIETGAPEVA